MNADRSAAPRGTLRPCGPRSAPSRSRRCLAVKPQNVEQHALEAGTERLGDPREESPHAAAAVLHLAPVAAHAERHLARLRVDLEIGEHAGEPGIRAIVVDDEAGVETKLAALIDHGNRVTVTARFVILLEHGHVVTAREMPRRGEAGDSRTDDGDLHSPSSTCLADDRIGSVGPVMVA
jgi:hypothetical protein